MAITKMTYNLVEKLPKSEEYVLSAQMKRAAVSIPANIAEGFRRRSKKEYKNYLHISLGSSAELETFIDLCRDVHGINGELTGDLQFAIEEFQRMTVSLINKLI